MVLSLLIQCYQFKRIIMKSSERSVLLLDINEPNLEDQIQKYVYKRQCYIDKYKIIRELGGGAFAKVYQCERNDNSETYALKVYSYAAIKYKFDQQSQQKMMGYINQEAKLMQKCKSPHVAKCYETLQSDHYKILILEYCPCGNLWQYLLRKGGKSKSLKEAEAVTIIKQISLGLIELHKNNIIHRDLKLQNIVIKNGVCKIIDLGLSRQLQSESCIMSTNVGTQTTQAPEVKKNLPYGLKADIFSLGIIYMMLISDCSFERRRAYNFYNNRELLFSNLLAVSPQSIDFINRAIEVNASKRMSWRQLLGHTLIKDVKTFTESQIAQVEQDLKAQLSQSKAIILDCLQSVQSHRTSIYMSSILEQQDQKAPINPIPSRAASLVYNDYPQEVRFYFLNCKKAQFILVQVICNLQKVNNKKIEKEQESHSIIIYLFSLQALNLVSEAHHYYQMHFYQNFLREVSELKQAITHKFQTYQSVLKDLLKCVKNCFIENEIFKNYEPLKEFLQFKDISIVNHNQKYYNLIDYYISKIVTLVNQKGKMRLLSYRQVMAITLEDLMISDFETKAAQIRMNYMNDKNIV